MRLYGADCLEHHVNDETDARRLRSQRRYFGIAEAGSDTAASIEFAKRLGAEATTETRRLLAEPFTLHTSFADGRGDARFKRIYGFVTDAKGNDLAEQLDAIAAELDDRAFELLREAAAERSGRPADDKRLTQARRAVEKAAHLLRSSTSDD